MNQRISVIEPIGVDPGLIKERITDCDLHVVDSTGWPDEKLIATLADTEILALTYRELSYQVISSLPQLKMISVAFAGIDHVDERAVAERNIVVKNAAGYANTAVGELVVGLMICTARQIPQLDAAMRKHPTTAEPGSELRGKTLGVVGFGAIGREVARLADVFGMTVVTYDAENERSDLEKLFADSDYVSIHLPLNDTTTGMIDSSLLGLMKPSAVLINAARGAILNHDDVVRALDNHSIAGMAFDVFDVEPPIPTDHPFLAYDNVIATPHIGFDTNEALATKGQICIDHIADYCTGT